LHVAFNAGAAHPNGMVVGEAVEKVKDWEWAFFVVGENDVHRTGFDECWASELQGAEGHLYTSVSILEFDL
jgi:hypothetical protein